MNPWFMRAWEDGGVPSSARIISGVCTAFALVWISYVTFKNGHLPDAISTGGITGFCTSHYLVNRATTAFGKQQGNSQPTEPQG